MKMITSSDDDKFILKYVYYWMNTLPSDLSDGNHKRHWISNFCKKRIPIPCPDDAERSLEIQADIVRILDVFTSLTARKKQYNYYRDQLLTFDEDGADIEWITVKELFHLKNGYTPSKATKEFWEDGTIPWFRMDDIRKNGKILDNSLQKVTGSAVKGGELFPKNSMIFATTATIGEHALITVPYLANQRFMNLSVKEKYAEKLDIKYLYYYGFLLADWCKSNTKMSCFPSVDMGAFRKFKIPIPSLEEQARIVTILDKFATLATSISEGLPREIELSNKQYKYYRDFLLNFQKDEKAAAR